MHLTTNAVKDSAECLLIEAGVFGVYPVPLERVAQSIGFDSLAFDGEQGISGAIRYDEKKIFVNKNDPPQRQRFTLAHEIGHARLHAGDNVIDYRANIDYPEEGTEKEREANRFAANLLMPEDDFLEVWRSRSGDVKRIANYFGVSEMAAGFRMKGLGLT
jgi:Zn-dependent peptidase ImmA (M78 family)